MKAREYAPAVVGLAASLLCACAPVPAQPEPPPPAPPPPPTADQQFEALAQRYLREAPEQSPVSATSLGDHRFDDRLDDVSAAGWQARLAFAELYLASLEPIDRGRLSRANQVDALLLRHDLQYDRWRFADAAGLALEPADLHAHSPATRCTTCWRAISRRCPNVCGTSARGSTRCRASSRRCARCSIRRVCRRSTRKPRRSRTPD